MRHNHKRISQESRRVGLIESLENRRLLSAGQAFYLDQDFRAGALDTVSTSGTGAAFLSGTGYPSQFLTDGTNFYVISGPAAPGPQLYSIEEFSATGQVINQSVLGDLTSDPTGSAISGSRLFAANQPAAGSVSEYTTGGQLVHALLITNLPTANIRLYVDGNLLLVSNGIDSGISAYNSSNGALVSSSFITPSASSGGQYFGLVLNNGSIFANSINGTVDQFDAASGTLTKEDILTLPNWQYTPYSSNVVATSDSIVATYMAIDNNQIFIAEERYSGGEASEMREYSMSGTLEATVDLPESNDLSSGQPIGLFVMGTSGQSLTDQLAFSASPTSTQIGSAIATTAVQIESPAGTATNDNLAVTLSLSGGIAGATLGGTTTVRAVNGVATFSDLSINLPGDGYTLTATCGAYQSAVSAPFSIIPKSVLLPSFGKTSVPASVVTGLPWGARLPVVLSNTGSLLHGKVTVNLFANTSPTLDGNQVLLKSVVRKKLVLRAGRRALIGISVPSLAADFAPGTYYLIAQVVDPLERTQLVATAQTITVAAPNVAGSVALVVTEHYTQALGQNQIVNLTVTVTNSGNVLLKGQTLSITSTYSAGLATVVVATHKFGRALAVNGIRTFKLRYRTTKATAPGLYFMLAGVSVAGNPVLVQGSAYLDLTK